MKFILKNFLCILIFLNITSCNVIALWTAQEKKSIILDTVIVNQAKKEFWDVFQNDQFNNINKLIENLTLVYLKYPNDPKITLLLAHSHFWRIAERSRLSYISPTITDELILSEKYFIEAKKLNPSDARIDGWLGGVKLALSKIHKDQYLEREGYFILKDAAKEFPEFNLFSKAYVLSSLNRDNPRFKESIDDLWQNLDKCVDDKIDRKNPDFSKYLTKEIHVGKKRVCWNSKIAPHNFEGFFLNFGDVLVKNGEAAIAKKIYAQARLSKSYQTWKFRNHLENQINSADIRALAYEKENNSKKQPDLMINSRHSCVACHAK